MYNYRVIDVVSRYRVSTILVHIADTRSSTALSLAFKCILLLHNNVVPVRVRT